MTVAGLSKNEAELAERTEHLLALVEETEYGIALPTTLRILSREMRTWKAGSRRATLPPARSPSRRASRKTCWRWSNRDPPALAHHAAAAGLAPLAGSEGTRARAQPPDRRAQDGPDDPGTAQRRHGRGRQEPPRRSNSAPRLKREVETLEATARRDSRSLAKIAERLPNPLEQ